MVCMDGWMDVWIFSMSDRIVLKYLVYMCWKKRTKIRNVSNDHYKNYGIMHKLDQFTRQILIKTR